MHLPPTALPDRTMAFPFLAVLSPVLWFLYRDATGVDRIATSLPRVLALVGAAVVVSYGVAALVAAALGPASAFDGPVESLLAPSNAALTVVAVAGAAFGAFLLADAVGVVSGRLTTVFAPFGMAVGWPVIAAVFLTYAVGNALGTELPFLVEAAVLVVGIVGAVAWLFVCSSRVASLAGDVVTGDRARSP